MTVQVGPSVPFKPNQDRRRHIPRQKHKVTNWREYDASLRQRGSLTVWFTDDAVQAWQAEPRTTRGGQPDYSPLAILTALTLRAVFRLPFRQTEGLIGSVIGLLGLDLAVPDHTTLCRRAATLEVPRPRPRRDGEPVRPCCMDQWEGRTHPYPVRGHAMRTDSGRPSSSMRFSTPTAMAASVACRPSVCERSVSPITRL